MSININNNNTTVLPNTTAKTEVTEKNNAQKTHKTTAKTEVAEKSNAQKTHTQPTTTKQQPTKGTVRLSETTRVLQQLANDLKNTSEQPIDHERVEQLKAALKNGTFNASSNTLESATRIADILTTELTNKDL